MKFYGKKIFQILLIINIVITFQILTECRTLKRVNYKNFSFIEKSNNEVKEIKEVKEDLTTNKNNESNNKDNDKENSSSKNELLIESSFKSLDSPYPIEDKLNVFIANTEITESKPMSSSAEGEFEVSPLTASSKTTFSWGFLNWNKISFPATNLLPNHSGYWQSKRDVMDDYVEFIFNRPTKIDYVIIHWKQPPKRFRAFFKLKDDQKYIPVTEVIEKWMPIKSDKLFSKNLISEYNTLIFIKPIFARRFQINMNEPAEKKSFAINKVKFYQKKTITMIRNLLVDPMTQQCLTVNSLNPVHNTPVYSYDCLKLIAIGDNRELFVYNPNKSIEHYNSKLCLGVENDILMLKNCGLFDPTYKVNVMPDTTLNFEHIPDKTIYIDGGRKISENYITEETKILVSSEFDGETLKKENINNPSDSSVWSSAVGQGRVSMQILFGKKKRGYEVLKVDVIKIVWLHPAKKFEVYCWKPNSSWKLIRKFEDYDEKVTNIDLSDKFEFCSSVMISMLEGHGKIINQNTQNPSSYNDNYNINNQSDDDSAPLSAKVVYSISNLYIGSYFIPVRLGNKNNLNENYCKFDFEEQSANLGINLDKYNRNYEKLNSSFNTLVGLNQQLSQNSKNNQMMNNLIDLNKSLNTKLRVALAYLTKKMLPGLRLFQSKEVNSLSNESLLNAMKKRNNYGYLANNRIKTGPSGIDLLSDSIIGKAIRSIKSALGFKVATDFGSKILKTISHLNSESDKNNSIESDGISKDDFTKPLLKCSNFPEDCFQIINNNPLSLSGYYYVQSKCSKQGPIRVFCDFKIYGNAVDIYVKKIDKYTNVTNINDIRYQCARYGLEPIEIKNKLMVNRIAMVLLHHGIDLDSNIVVPLGYDYDCQNIAEVTNPQTQSLKKSLFSWVKNKASQIVKNVTGINLKCSGQFRSLIDKNSQVLNSLFEEDQNRNIISKFLSNRPKSGEFIGLGYGIYDSSRKKIVPKKAVFNLTDNKVRAVVCSSNHFQSNNDDQGFLRLNCEDTIIDPELSNKFNTNSSINIICPSNCDKFENAEVFGTNYYYPISSICKSAIHANILGTSGGKAIVKVFISDNPLFTASSNNGINSKVMQFEENIKYNKAFSIFNINQVCPMDKIKNCKDQLKRSSMTKMFSFIEQNSLIQNKSSFIEVSNENGILDIDGKIGDDIKFTQVNNEYSDDEKRKAESEVDKVKTPSFDPSKLAKDAVNSVSNLINNRQLTKNYYEREYRRSLDLLDPRNPSALRYPNPYSENPFNPNVNPLEYNRWNIEHGKPGFWDYSLGHDPYYNDPYNINNPNSPFYKESNAEKAYKNWKNGNPPEPKISDSDLLREPKDQLDNKNFQLRGTGYDANPKAPDASVLGKSFGSEMTSAKPFINPIPPDVEDEETLKKRKQIPANFFTTETSIKRLDQMRQTGDMSRIRDSKKLSKNLNNSMTFFKRTLDVFRNKLSPDSQGNLFRDLVKLNNQLEKGLKAVKNLADKRINNASQLINSWRKSLAEKARNLNLSLGKKLFSIPGITAKSILSSLFSFMFDKKTSLKKQCGNDNKNALNLSWSSPTSFNKNRPYALQCTASPSIEFASTILTAKDKLYYDIEINVDVLLNTNDSGNSGVTFRMKDKFNYYAFVINKTKGYKAIVKVINGFPIFLYKKSDGGLLTYEWYRITIVVQASTIKVLVVDIDSNKKKTKNNTSKPLLMTVYDTQFKYGSVGLFCNNVNSILFDDLNIKPLKCWTGWETKKDLKFEYQAASVFKESFKESLKDAYKIVDPEFAMNSPSKWGFKFNKEKGKIEGILQSSTIFDKTPNKFPTLLLKKEKVLKNGILKVGLKPLNKGGNVGIVFRYSDASLERSRKPINNGNNSNTGPTNSSNGNNDPNNVVKGLPDNFTNPNLGQNGSAAKNILDNDQNNSDRKNGSSSSDPNKMEYYLFELVTDDIKPSFLLRKYKNGNFSVIKRVDDLSNINTSSNINMNNNGGNNTNNINSNNNNNNSNNNNSNTNNNNNNNNSNNNSNNSNITIGYEANSRIDLQLQLLGSVISIAISINESPFTTIIKVKDTSYNENASVFGVSSHKTSVIFEEIEVLPPIDSTVPGDIQKKIYENYELLVKKGIINESADEIDFSNITSMSNNYSLNSAILLAEQSEANNLIISSGSKIEMAQSYLNNSSISVSDINMSGGENLQLSSMMMSSDNSMIMSVNNDMLVLANSYDCREENRSSDISKFEKIFSSFGSNGSLGFSINNNLSMNSSMNQNLNSSSSMYSEMISKSNIQGGIPQSISNKSSYDADLALANAVQKMTEAELLKSKYMQEQGGVSSLNAPIIIDNSEKQTSLNPNSIVAGWNICINSVTSLMRKNYCSKITNEFQKKSCDNNFCDYCCESNISSSKTNIVHICKKTCHYNTAAEKDSKDYVPICINADNPFSTYSYCDKTMEKNRINICKLDMCNLCCVLSEKMVKANFSNSTTAKCFEDCGKEYNKPNC